MAIPTYVKSINGQSGSSPLQPDPEIAVDGNNIYVSGSTGTTVKANCQAIADNMKTLEIETINLDGDVRIRIGNYRLSMN